MGNNIKKYQKKVKKEKEYKKNSSGILIIALGIITIIGFSASLFFLVTITGGVIGTTRGNLYGLIFLIILMLIWAALGISWSKKKKKEKVDIREILQESSIQRLILAFPLFNYQKIHSLFI